MTESAQEPEGLTVIARERFERTRFIDQGQNARIYRAHDTILHRDVVFKTSVEMSVATRLGDHDFEAFPFSEDIMAALAQMRIIDGLRRRYSVQREAELMCQIEHPNVLSVIDVGVTEDGDVVLVMPYLRGGTLASRQPLRGWQEILDLLLEIGEGIAAIHAAGLLHRDIKPNNILFGDDGRPQIADFGLACRIDDDEFMADWVGTDLYMAPEVLAKESRDVRDDLYAFCVIAYELFYGHAPFSTNSARVGGRVRPSVREAGMSSPVHAVMVRGLAADPNERWPDMPTLLDALKIARTQPPQPPRRSWVTRSVWAAAFTAAVAVGIALSVSSAEADECEEVTREIETIWNDDVRDELREVLGTRKAGDGLQNWVARWIRVRALECEAASAAGREPVPTPCSGAARERLRATIHAFQTPHLRDDLSFAAVLAELHAPEHCLDDPNNSGWDDDTPAELRNLDVEIEALVRLGDRSAAGSNLDEYARLAQEQDSPYAQLRARFWDAELHRLAGRLEEARAVFEDVHDQALSLHAPVLGAEAQMKLVAIAGALGEFDVAEAHARGARAVFEEHRPERVPELLRVQGLALLEDPKDRGRGLQLLSRAVELREAQLEAHPGSLELLSQAQESYARGLLTLGRAGEALGLLELAQHSHQGEFGHGTWRTHSLLKSKFLAYATLNEWDAADATRKSILGNLDAYDDDWSIYIEDATWIAGLYRQFGESRRSVDTLLTARSDLTSQGLHAEAERIGALFHLYLK